MSKTPYADLAKAMSEMKNPAFNAVNPHFKNKFADLKAVSDACRSALLNNNIMALQSYEHRQFGQGDDFMIVWGICTKLVHASGEVLLDSFYPINGALDDQKKGSASTYGRRYSLVMACGLVGDPDDDGNAASAVEPKKVDNTVEELTNYGKALKAVLDNKDATMDDLHDVLQKFGDVYDKATDNKQYKKYIDRINELAAQVREKVSG